MKNSRREFIRQLSLAALAAPVAVHTLHAGPAAAPISSEDQKLLDLINANRPSRLAQLPADFNARFGATHSDGKYFLTHKPFLIEGAEKILDLGARLGKFWFALDASKKFYSFNSHWPECQNLVELAQTDYFQAVWQMPFQTIMLTTTAPSEKGWRHPNLGKEFYERITQDYYDLAAFFYRQFRDRDITVILQNWEGDWMLRGIGKPWNPPDSDWRERCEQMQRWIIARQSGVSRAHAEFGSKSKCTVALCVEVNRVADAWKGIPTVTRNVLPGVEVDLVSYSAYDGINSGDPILFWKCLQEIREHMRTGPLFGPGALAVGEYGVAENDKHGTDKPEKQTPARIRERYDQMLGVMLLLNVHYAAMWELYCNELVGKPAVPPPTPVTDPELLRGFWLVKPDGSLSVAGKYFTELWQRTENKGKWQVSAPKNLPKAN
jgi:hypothetical protein